MGYNWFMNRNNMPVHCGSLFTWEGKQGYARAEDFDFDVANGADMFMVRSHRTSNLRVFKRSGEQSRGGKSSVSYFDGHHTITIYS